MGESEGEPTAMAPIKTADESFGKDKRRVAIFCASPRRNGNSRLLAEAFAEGVAAAGNKPQLVHLPDYVREMLRDCKECRRPDGSCAIDDRFEELLKEIALPAEGWVYATPLWWYGVSAHLKNFLDRIFCYMSPAAPGQERLYRELPNKRTAVLMSAEENNLAARLGVLGHIEELCRYLHHDLVGFVTGIGNSRGDVKEDPAKPLEHARELGRWMFEIKEKNYFLDTERGKKVWEERPSFRPVVWR